ncbi:nitric oxide synthase oxygenase [Amycolatopsis sp. NPDC059021]|uniref:nitric oxide synthase oxygenase n=1 Tax=Amycolatopsis sp. NPDC059021 TaxID=3346704 RepID=UPI00366F3BCA
MRVTTEQVTGRREKNGERAVEFAEAEEFVRQCQAEGVCSGERPARRLARIRAEIERTGTYRHTTAELTFGARVAWRNAARCIGRLYWRGLRIRDRRDVSSAAAIARECVLHLREATRGGRIRPTVTVFAPDTPAAPGPRIHNEQLIRYAGYELDDGSVLGDPRYTAFTERVRARGWRPPRRRGAFDVLPLLVESAPGEPRLFTLPRDAVLEVPLRHPDHAWFANLGLRWHAVPAISDMPLVIGGVRYPAAPFNGWYLGTEVGARNLADAGRYDLLPAIAKLMGLSTASERTLWRDRALVELTLAVQYSFDEAGVTVADHHTESRRFLDHLAREERAGRRCRADWSWIVPPLSGGQTVVFHRYYDEPDPAQRPAFVPPG